MIQVRQGQQCELLRCYLCAQGWDVFGFNIVSDEEGYMLFFPRESDLRLLQYLVEEAEVTLQAQERAPVQPASAEAAAVEMCLASEPLERLVSSEGATLAQQAPAAGASMNPMTESGTGGAPWVADELERLGTVRRRTPLAGLLQLCTYSVCRGSGVTAWCNLQGDKGTPELREPGSESGNHTQDTGSAIMEMVLSAQETEEAVPAQPVYAEATAVELSAASAPPRPTDLGDAAALAQQAPAAGASMVLVTESGTGCAPWDADELECLGTVRRRTPLAGLLQSCTLSVPWSWCHGMVRLAGQQGCAERAA